MYITKYSKSEKEEQIWIDYCNQTNMPVKTLIVILSTVDYEWMKNNRFADICRNCNE